MLYSEQCVLSRGENLCTLLHDQFSLLGDVSLKVLYSSSFHHGVCFLADIVGDLDTFPEYLGLLGFISVLTSLQQLLKYHLILSQALDGSGRYKENISGFNMLLIVTKPHAEICQSVLEFEKIFQRSEEFLVLRDDQAGHG